MWPGVEPNKDEFNKTYMNVIESIINEAGK